VGPHRDYKKDRREEECEEECAAGGKSAPAFWGVIILLVGLLIVFEVVKAIFEESLPQWFLNLELWWIIGLVIALAIIMAGFRMVTKRT
jgi:uncharacterized protein (DUF983 family)